MPIALNNFPEFRPYSNVQPFTVRDGATFLLQLEALKDWIRDYVVPHINSEIGGLTENWETQTLALIENFERITLDYVQQVQELANGVSDDKDAAEQARVAAEAARDLAEQFASDAEEIQDAAIAAIFGNLSSAFRTAADAAYASVSRVGDIEDILNSGRLSEAILDAAFDDKVDKSTYNAYVLAVSGTLGDIQSDIEDLELVAEEVNEGRLAPDNLAKQISEDTISIKKGGDYGIGLFQYMRDGAKNPNQDTRVVILGSSTANGGYTPYADQAVFNRLAHRAGADAGLERLEPLSSPQAPNGMRWITGAIGGQTSANYAQSGTLNLVKNVAPHYVIHMVGSNDWRNSVNPATYKANVLAAVNTIESDTLGVVNVLIHQQGRRDFGPAYSWDAYGTALREIAEASPENRVFIDMTEFFRVLGVENDNRAGIGMSDLIHMYDTGHLFMADILSTIMGIPTESDFRMKSIRPITWPATDTYNPNTTVVSMDIVPANYPRNVRVDGVCYVTPSTAGGGNEIATELTDSSNNVISRKRHRVPNTLTAPMTLTLADNHYLAPGVAAKIRIQAFATGTITVSGAAEYASGEVTIEAI